MKDENEVGIADLKAHLSEHLKAVRRGHPLTILDRDRAIARIVPYEPSPLEIRVRKAIGSIHEVKLPPPLNLTFDAVDLLIEERRRDR